MAASASPAVGCYAPIISVRQSGGHLALLGQLTANGPDQFAEMALIAAQWRPTAPRKVRREMAIAPSKLGLLLADEWDSDDGLVRRLRAAGLVRKGVPDNELRAAFRRARDEHEAMSPERRHYNSPNERARVYLAPFLSDKGSAWAVPLDSLKLPDD